MKVALIRSPNRGPSDICTKPDALFSPGLAVARDLCPSRCALSAVLYFLLADTESIELVNLKRSMRVQRKGMEKTKAAFTCAALCAEYAACMYSYTAESTALHLNAPQDCMMCDGAES